MKRVLISILAGCSIASINSSALAGGYELGGYDWDVLFDDGRIVASTAYLGYKVERNLSDVNGPLGVGESASVTQDNGFPNVGVKFKPFDPVDCLISYQQPWGVDNQFPTNWAGATDVIEERIKSRDLGVTCSYSHAFDNGHRLRGLGGVSFQKLEGRQTAFLPAGSAGFGQPDRIASVDVDDNGIGWRVGLSYEIPEIALRASVIYNAPVSYNLSGNLNNVAPVPIPIEGDAETPQSVEVHLQSGISETTLVFAKAKWTEWSNRDAVFFCPVGTPQSQCSLGSPNVLFSNDLYYDDSINATIGIGHQLTEKIAISGAFVYEQGTRSELTTDTDVYIAALGFEYAPVEKVVITLGGFLGHLDSGDIDTRVIGGIANPAGYTAKLDSDMLYGLTLGAKVSF